MSSLIFFFIYYGVLNKYPKIKERFMMFKHLVPKELNRENHIDAISFYQRVILESLVELLRIKYDPARYDFKSMYLKYHLPAYEYNRLKGLFYIRDLADLKEKFEKAQEWVHELLSGIGIEDVRRTLMTGSVSV